MMKLPHRLTWGQLTRHSSKFGVQRSVHQTSGTGAANPSPPATSTKKTKKYKEIQIPVPWGHISGKWWGPLDVQPVLGLHGWQDNAGTWDRLAPNLPSDMSFLALDFPGHGLSSHFHPGRCYHLIEYVSFIRRIHHYYSWEKLSFLSHSMGSITSFVYACVFPDKVHKLVGVDAMKPYSYNPIKNVRKLGVLIDTFIGATRMDPVAAPTYTYGEARTRLVAASKGSVGSEVAHHLLERGLAKTPDGRYKFTRDPRLKVPQLMNWTHQTIMELSSNIRCEVCAIHANPGLVYDSPENHNDVYDVVDRSAKHLEIHIVEGAHHVHLSKPEAILPIVLDFLKKKVEDKPPKAI